MAPADVFAREGEFWTVAFDGSVSRLRDSKGMGYLAELLRRPGEEVPALELAGARTVEGGAGEVLDSAAVRAYRQRAEELRDELAEARALDDADRAARARLELEALAEQLSAGVGLRGRRRLAAAPGERARVAVTKAIRTALARIREADPDLGRHLDATVRTGTFCSYRPDTRLVPRWQAERPAPTEPVAGAPPGPSDAGAAAREPPPVPPLARHRAPFVGRATELRALQDRVAAAARGAGGVALVAGEPGVGKSRLLDELASACRSDGVAVLAGRCVDADAAVAFLPFVDVLEQVLTSRDDRALARILGEDAAAVARLVPQVRRRLPDVPAPADAVGDQARRALFRAVGEVLERLAGERPLLLVLEDLHWADGPSLALLEHLAARVPAMPVLVVGTYRQAESVVGTALGRALERLLARHDVLTVALDPLDPPAVEELVRQLHGGPPPARLLEQLLRESGGNPFFVEELYQHVRERGGLRDDPGPIVLPDSIRLVLGHRLERLSPPCRDALTLGAVAGRDFDETLLAAAGAPKDTLVDALDEALAAGLLTVAAAEDRAFDRFRFSHALVRGALLAGLSPARRRRLHLALARAVEALHPDDPLHAAELADHLDAAGREADLRVAALAQRRAATRLLEVGAFEEALDRIERAVERCPAGEPALVAELLADRGAAKRALGRLDEAFADWYAALEHGGRDWPRAARVCRDLARCLDITGRLDEAIAAARRGLELVRPDAGAERSRLLASLAYGLGLAGATAEAERVLQEARREADGLGDARVVGDVEAVAVTHHFITGDHAAEARAAHEASAALLAAGEVWDGAQATMMRMLGALRRGRLDEAAALDGQVAAAVRRSGHVIADLWRRRCIEGVRLARSGDVAAYAAFVAEDLAYCRAHRLRWVADALLHAGLCDFWLGDLDRARAHLDEAAATPTPPAYIGRYSSARFLVEAWAGHEAAFERHRAAVERALTDAGPEAGWTLGRAVFELSSLEGDVLLGRHEHAARRHGAVARAADGGMVLRLGDLRLVPVLRALAAACAGRREEAAAAAAEARRLVDTGPLRREAPDVEFFDGLLAELRGEGAAERRAAFARAAAGYRRLGMPLHARLAAARA